MGLIKDKFWYPSEESENAILLCGQVFYEDNSFDHEFGKESRTGYSPVSDTHFNIFVHAGAVDYDMTEGFRSGYPCTYQHLKGWFDEQIKDNH